MGRPIGSQPSGGVMQSSVERTQRLAWEANRFFKQGKLPDPFTCARLEKGAEQAKVTDPLNAHLILARLASMQQQPQRMRGHHLSIINLTPDRPKSHVDYADSLMKLGFFSEAQERLRIANELLPDDGGILQNLVRGSMLAGRFREAAITMDQLFDLDRQVTIRQYHFIREALELVQKREISDDALEALQKSASGYLHQQGHFTSGSLRAPSVQMELVNPGAGVTLPGGGRITGLFLRWGLQLEAEKAQIGTLNQGLQAHLKDQVFDEALMGTVRMRFTPWRNGTHGTNAFFS
ncbi:MAG: hypothetical protein HQL53_13090 [Magnetococcales bacterium]|nr:hypothetical protein [Magnetococcales bacterium]